MAGTARGRIDELFETYVIALAAIDQCPESAGDEVKRRLTENVERAEQAFAEAAADGLDLDSPVVGAAVTALTYANTASRVSLRDGQPIAALVTDLERATDLALEVLSAARG
jgi:hypothetical protein